MQQVSNHFRLPLDTHINTVDVVTALLAQKHE